MAKYEVALPDAQVESIILTVRGRGYMFAGERS